MPPSRSRQPSARPAGIEFNAGVGATCFLIGTLMYDAGPLDAVWTAVLALWTVGSIFFTFGGMFMAYRHFVMHKV
jgi:hypothetical protein